MMPLNCFVDLGMIVWVFLSINKAQANISQDSSRGNFPLIECGCVHLNCEREGKEMSTQSLPPFQRKKQR
jgi:hypothetical protein